MFLSPESAFHSCWKSITFHGFFRWFMFWGFHPLKVNKLFNKPVASNDEKSNEVMRSPWPANHWWNVPCRSGSMRLIPCWPWLWPSFLLPGGSLFFFRWMITSWVFDAFLVPSANLFQFFSSLKEFDSFLNCFRDVWWGNFWMNQRHNPTSF